jgi:hypothetical protein
VGTAVRSKPSGRALVAIGVLLLWVVGLGFLAQRELFRPRLERLTEAGLRINQYTSFFALRKNGELVGYASSIVDTTTSEININDQMIRELSVRRRASKSAKTRLTRTFKLKDFEWRVNTGTVDMRSRGRVEGDSLIYSVQTNDKPPTTGVIKLDGPVLVPSLVPHAIALMNDPKVGRKYTLPVFDPTQRAIVQVKSEIQKETTFVLADSAVLDSTTREWKPVRQVEIKGFLIRSSAGGFNGWLDETGHIIRNNELDADVLRSTIEEAFENWMIGVNRRRRAAGLLSAPGDSLPPPPRPTRPLPPGRGKLP